MDPVEVAQTPVMAWMCADPRLQTVLKAFGCALKQSRGMDNTKVRIATDSGGALDVLYFRDFFRRKILTLSSLPPSRRFGAFGFFVHPDCHHGHTHHIIPSEYECVAFLKKEIPSVIADLQKEFSHLYLFGGIMHNEKADDGLGAIEMFHQEYWRVIGR